MKKRFKGFTLIECLVALAILGVASLTMAQIYASVSQRNKMNHLVNTSLTNQMKYVEEETDSEAVGILYNGPSSGTPPHESVSTQPAANGVGKQATSTDKSFLMITSSYTDKRGTVSSSGSGGNNKQNSYSAPVDIYVLMSRDRYDNQLSSSSDNAGYTEDEDNLRYKYLLGHN